VSAMCNLSQGIREKGRAEGRAESEKEFILNMYENDFTLEQIAVAARKSVGEIEVIIKERESVLV